MRKMNKLRKRIILISLLVFVSTLGISIYFKIKSDKMEELASAELNEFNKTHLHEIAGEGFYNTQEEETQACRLFFKSINSKEHKLSWRYGSLGAVGFIISTTSFVIFIFVLIWNLLRKLCNLLRKLVIWSINNPQKGILVYAASFFLGTWLYLPWIDDGRIYYSFLMLQWKSSRIFWALLLIEWTAVLLPFGLVYKRLYERTKSIFPW